MAIKENKFSRWLYSRPLIKTWFVIFLVSLLFVSFGLTGIVGHIFPKMDLSKIISAKTFSANVRNAVNSMSKLVTVDFIVLGLGIWGMFVAVRRGTYAVLTVVNPGRKGAYFKSVYAQLKLKRGPRIVVLGGETGTAPLLEGLSRYTENITVIALPAENNIRNAVVALAGSNESIKKLFGYKFESSGLKSVDFGGLFLDALIEETGGQEKALKEATRVLSLAGRVIPAVGGRVSVELAFANGRKADGRIGVMRSRSKIASVSLKPKPKEANPEAVKAIYEADALVLGPGSLFSAILPLFLIDGIKEAVVRSKCAKIYAANIMTQKNETEGYFLSDHVKKVMDYAGGQFLHYVVASSGAVPEEVLIRYKKYGSSQVEVDAEEVEKLGVRVILKKMSGVSETGLIRHDGNRLGRAVIKAISI